MELYSYEGWIPLIVEGFYTWFSFYCIICLLVRLFASSKIKQEASNIQAVTNLALAVAGIFTMIMWIRLLYYIQKERTDFSHLYYTDQLFFGSMVLFWIISILFFFKFRRSWLLSLLALMCVNIEFIYSLVVRMWRDYLPSAWSVTYGIELRFIQFFSFTLLSFLLYWLLARRKKLPYPSAWLR
jgi:hypothetical protein